MNQRIFLIISLLIQVPALVLLATGSSFLLEPFLGTALPWGNLLAWLLLTLFPTNFLLIRRQGTVAKVPLMVFRFCVIAGFVLGLLWLPVSRLLAENWSNSFQGGGLNQQVWTYYTYAAAIFPFAGYFLMKFLGAFYKGK